jgi:chromosome segregation ATPase
LSKIDDKIAIAQEKLQETKQKFETTQKRDQELIKEKARLKASELLENRQDGKRVAEIDRQRDRLRSELEIYPDLLREVEAKIEGLKKEKVEGILRENLAKQKKVAREVERLSGELGTLLTRANEANIELQKQRSQYFELYKLTNQGVFEKPTTLGSQGWLRVLAGTVKAELAGEGRPMPRYPGAAPPI